MDTTVNPDAEDLEDTRDVKVPEEDLDLERKSSRRFSTISKAYTKNWLNSKLKLHYSKPQDVIPKDVTMT